MPRVFISYARDGSYGENLAVEIQQQLQAAGFAVFRDVIGLKPGDVWYRTLEFELESSDVMVLVVSEKVRTSKWVHNEVSMAEEIGIPVIPVLAEKVRYPLWLRHLQSLDFCGTVDWSLLLGALGHHVGSGGVGVREIPVWASVAGDDQYGRYADLVVKGITQKFRWIEPGTFWMGSPESEPGRSNNEARHQVTLTKGYWLGDTACTQALWKIVMGSNPSGFQDYYPQELVTDPTGLELGMGRIIRGGSWYNHGRLVRSAYRAGRNSTERDKGIGFRLALGL